MHARVKAGSVLLLFALVLSLVPAAMLPSPASAQTVCDRAQFVADVTVPDGMRFDPGATFTKNASNTQGTFTWTPQPGQEATYNLDVIAESGVLNLRTLRVCKIVVGPDRPPVVTVPAAATVAEGDPLTVDVTAGDRNGRGVHGRGGSGAGRQRRRPGALVPQMCCQLRPRRVRRAHEQHLLGRRPERRRRPQQGQHVGIERHVAAARIALGGRAGDHARRLEHVEVEREQVGRQLRQRTEHPH